MKILVRDLRPNPFRHIEKYPILRDKVDSLKNSINETEFWDNVLARESPEKQGVYEIAYGHHRLTALRELGIKEVDIPVRKLDDATMIRIMANENMDDWRTMPAVINETVIVAKKFIDAEMAKVETWEMACADKNIITTLVGDAKGFVKLRDQGAGREVILKFLGGNWKQWMIQESLATIKDPTVDREAIELFDSQEAAKEFRQVVKKSKIPVKKQKELAKKIINDKEGTSRKIKAAVEAAGFVEKVKANKDKKTSKVIHREVSAMVKRFANVVSEAKDVLRLATIARREGAISTEHVRWFDNKLDEMENLIKKWREDR